MFHALLPHPDLAQDIPLYIVHEDPFEPDYFLRKNVLGFCVDIEAVSIDGKPPPGPILGNSFNSPPQHYEKRRGALVLAQFLAGTWSRLLGVNPARFDRIHSLGDADCKGIERLYGKLGAASGNLGEVTRVLDAFFLEKLADAEPRGLPERIRAEILEDIDAPMARIAQAVRVSERTVQRVFRRRFGISPSHYKRIARLYKSLDQGRGLEIAWMGVPPDLRFADQSHWIREFRKLEGITPSQYKRRPTGRWTYHDRKGEILCVTEGLTFNLPREWLDHFHRGLASHDLSLEA